MASDPASRARPIASLVSAAVPEGRLKEWLRQRFWKRYDPLRSLDSLISTVKIMDSDSIFVQMRDSTRFYGLAGGTPWPRLRLAELGELARMKAFYHFGSLLGLLREIYVDGIYERYYVPKAGEVIIDTGAHIGIFTVKMARAVGKSGRVIAIEPDERNLRYIRRNIEANSLTNVTVVPQGAWSIKSILKLNRFPGGSALSSFHTAHFTGTERPSTSSEVAVDTLDNIARKLRLNRVNFIKMDIEGAELEAVKGLAKTLSQDNLRMAIAAYHIVNGQPTYKAIIPELQRKGFKATMQDEIVYAQK